MTVTERRVRNEVSESHQKEVKKPEEQVSVRDANRRVPRVGVDDRIPHKPS